MDDSVILITTTYGFRKLSFFKIINFSFIET